MLRRPLRRSPRSVTGAGLSTVGRRLQNLGRILQARDGFKLRRLGLSAGTVEILRQTTRINGTSPRTVLDVGAHRGEFLQFVAAAFPNAQIHCFEPVAESFAVLRERAGKIGRDIQCHPVALGKESGEVAIHVNRFTAASSAFDASPLHRQAFPETAEAPITQTVACRQLDAWANEYELDRPILLKIDVQGGELEVLEGARRTLRETAFVVVELSFDQLYLGAPLAHDVMHFLNDCGFRLVEFLSDLRDPASGRLLQADAIFAAIPRATL